MGQILQGGALAREEEIERDSESVHDAEKAAKVLQELHY